MRRTTLAELGAAGLAAAFNTVYEGYVVPMTVDAGWAAQHIGGNDVRVAESPLWLDEGGVVALSALGVRGDRGWIGGFGVAPSHRGQGLSHELVAEVLARARRLGLREVWLEVLTQNAAAIRTYERNGFRRVRDLRVLRRQPHAPAPERAIGPGGVLAAVDPAVLLPGRATLGAARPSWQFEAPSLAAMPGVIGLCLGDPAAPRAFALYRVGELALHLLDLAAGDADSARALLSSLVHRYPGRTMHRTNEPADSPATTAFEATGWIEVLRQHELVCPL